MVKSKTVAKSSMLITTRPRSTSGGIPGSTARPVRESKHSGTEARGDGRRLPKQETEMHVPLCLLSATLALICFCNPVP